eukprot:1107645-Pelagomonas_calceolata.AAC.3
MSPKRTLRPPKQVGITRAALYIVPARLAERGLMQLLIDLTRHKQLKQHSTSICKAFLASSPTPVSTPPMMLTALPLHRLATNHEQLHKNLFREV